MGRMLEVAAPSKKAEVVVTDVTRILKPTDSMTRPTRSTVSLTWPVLKYAPVIMNVSSRPTPKITKTRRFVMIVTGTPEETNIFTLNDQRGGQSVQAGEEGISLSSLPHMNIKPYAANVDMNTVTTAPRPNRHLDFNRSCL
jgi:hypothetical protein